ncbi:MAG TPA: thiamine pyrophosphate-binding protein, partial [Nocardioidaceae bacterium]|nr:thiamine pyrophosphate-binding protein [Nocardioidaceae bacterium]
MSRTPEYGSDVVIDLMVDLDIDYVSFNPGATFRGLHDSIVNYAGSDIEFIECLHEEISVALAHGYAKAAGKPMAAAVHDVVGLQHASMAIYNAWMDQVPMLVLGATGPVDATKRRPWTDWIHTALVQGTQVRDYTKWDDQPGSIAAVPESIIRAVQISNTAPRGPVYVCLDHDIQEDPIPDGFTNLDVADFAAPADAAPDPEAVERVVDWLVNASSPVVIADMVGRSQSGLELLVELAEALALPVVDRERNYNKVSMNFPTAHPLNASGDPDALAGADVVLALEMRDLSGVLGRTGAPTVRGRGRMAELAAGAKVVNVTMASYVGGSWISEMQRLHA